MVSKNYSEEIGLSTAQRIMPMPYVIAIIAAILALGWLGFSTRSNAHGKSKISAATIASGQAPIEKV